MVLSIVVQRSIRVVHLRCDGVGVSQLLCRQTPLVVCIAGAARPQRTCVHDCDPRISVVNAALQCVAQAVAATQQTLDWPTLPTATHPAAAVKQVKRGLVLVCLHALSLASSSAAWLLWLWDGHRSNQRKQQRLLQPLSFLAANVCCFVCPPLFPSHSSRHPSNVSHFLPLLRAPLQAPAVSALFAGHTGRAAAAACPGDCCPAAGPPAGAPHMQTPLSFVGCGGPNKLALLLRRYFTH